MAITMTPYDYFKANAMGGVAPSGVPIDYLSDTINAALVVNTYIPSIASHIFWNDVVANELVSGSGYTANGLSLANKAITVIGGNANYDADNLSWLFTAEKTFRYLVLMKWTGTAATSPLMCLLDFGVDRTEDSQFDVRWDSNGIFRLD